MPFALYVGWIPDLMEIIPFLSPRSLFLKAAISMEPGLGGRNLPILLLFLSFAMCKDDDRSAGGQAFIWHPQVTVKIGSKHFFPQKRS